MGALKEGRKALILVSEGYVSGTAVDGEGKDRRIVLPDELP